ncbi:MAG: GMP synthase subunit A [Candidatus Micrarchaeota archaeon]
MPVVNLGSQWTHRIWRTLRDLDTETRIVEIDASIESLKDADGLVLSGGAVRIGKGESARVGNCSRFLDELDIPVIGVCAGQQFIALHYGAEVGPAVRPEYGRVELTVLEEDDLFKGLPREFTVWASHNDEIKKCPGFRVLARSPDCLVHAIKHESKPLYGVLFHPEVEHSQHGAEVYSNFLSVCKR